MDTEPTASDHHTLSSGGDNPWDSVMQALQKPEIVETDLLPRESLKAKLYPAEKETAKKRQLAALFEAFPLGITEQSIVLYPGSAADATFADVIGGRQVIHIDPDEVSIRELQTEGYVGVPTTKEQYYADNPGLVGAVDMIISYNAGKISGEEVSFIRPGGYVLANNWHDSANAMARREDFELVGAVDQFGVVQDTTIATEALGYERSAMLHGGGNMVFGADEIAKLEKGTYAETTESRNTETIWLFRKKDSAPHDELDKAKAL
ncbi:MAG TPA: hypothetical protein PKD19_01700 [Candidatus Saccharibacteria bacterium]|nr:hypothetical protein [Candidatus Saccharibacteria bacterium]HMR38086.1 hypothetical protein [Candidatus Saccharibacteria bacterium]